MPPELIIALSSSPVLVAALGAWGASRKTRRSSETDHQVMAAKVDALADGVSDLDKKVDAVKDDMQAIRKEHGERLARIEGQFEGHLLERSRRG